MGKLHCPVFSSGWGDMELLESDGKFLLIDTFTKGNTKPRAYVKNILNGRKCDLLFSHGHQDHNDDAEWYIKNNLIKHLYVSIHQPGQETHKDRTRQNNIISLCKSKGIPVTQLGTGDSFSVGKATVKVLYAKSTGGNNAKSLCLMVVLNGVKILLCGDAETSTVNEMLKKNSISCDIAKFNHHGVKENNPSVFPQKAKASYAFCNCCDESSSTFRSWAKESYAKFEAQNTNCVSVLYNGGIVFDCYAGEFNVLMGRNYKTAIGKIKRDGFVVEKQFHYCDKEPLHITKSMEYIDLQLAKDTICGRFGNGSERTEKLKDKAATIQKLVNGLIGEYADRMIAGEGGNGEANRTAWLAKCGFIYDPAVAYSVIQGEVNRRTK